MCTAWGQATWTIPGAVRRPALPTCQPTWLPVGLRSVGRPGRASPGCRQPALPDGRLRRIDEITVASLNLHWGLGLLGQPYDVAAAVCQLDAEVICLQEAWLQVAGASPPSPPRPQAVRRAAQTAAPTPPPGTAPTSGIAAAQASGIAAAPAPGIAPGLIRRSCRSSREARGRAAPGGAVQAAGLHVACGAGKRPARANSASPY